MYLKKSTAVRRKKKNGELLHLKGLDRSDTFCALCQIQYRVMTRLDAWSIDKVMKKHGASGSENLATKNQPRKNVY